MTYINAIYLFPKSTINLIFQEMSEDTKYWLRSCGNTDLDEYSAKIGILYNFSDWSQTHQGLRFWVNIVDKLLEKEDDS